MNPTNLLSDLDRSTSNERSGEQLTSTKANDTENNLNRRLNIDGDNDDDDDLIGCINSVVSLQGKLPNIQSRPKFNQNASNFHRRLSPLRRTNGGKDMQLQKIYSVPLRRLPYQLHRKKNKN